MTVTNNYFFIFKQRKKIKNKSRKSQIPDDFIIFASDFAADFLARLKKTLGQTAAFFRRGAGTARVSRQAFGRNSQTLNILFDPIPKQIAGVAKREPGTALEVS